MRGARNGATMTSKARLLRMAEAASISPEADTRTSISALRIKLSCSGAFHRRRSDEQSSHCRYRNRSGQALTILLIIGREREMKKLRELVTQQWIFISEIKGWLMRERIEPAQPRRMKPDREPIADEIKAPEIKIPEIKYLKYNSA